MSNKKLKIQVSVCRRLTKEVASYEREAASNEARIQRMRDEGKDEYDIRKQEEVLQESYMMIPDSKARLEAALEELSACLQESVESGDALDETIVAEARGMLHIS